MYEQDTVRIHVEYSSHMQVRLSICTSYLTVESVLVLWSNLKIYSQIYVFLLIFVINHHTKILSYSTNHKKIYKIIIF